MFFIAAALTMIFLSPIKSCPTTPLRLILTVGVPRYDTLFAWSAARVSNLA